MKNLAAKFLFALAFVSFGTAPQSAGIPVIDGTNLKQNTLNALESVAQTLKQIQQYQTQLEQYENQLQNTLAPSMYVWDQALKTMAKLQDATNTLEYYKRQLGDIDRYLARYQNVNYYRSAECFQKTGCTQAQRAALDQKQLDQSDSIKRAHDAAIRGLEMQQQDILKDAQNLQTLQQSAQSATGQMQALGYANQLASAQANQLLQIRALLIAQQNTQLEQQQVDADVKAQQAAASRVARESRAVPAPAKPVNMFDIKPKQPTSPF